MRWLPPAAVPVEVSPKIVGALRVGAYMAVGIALLIGVGALIGWTTGTAWLKDPVHGFTPMKPNTALMVTLSSLSLGLSVEPMSARQGRLRRLTAAVLSASSATLALALLAEDALGRDLGGIDGMLVHLPHLRPSVPTTVGLLLVDCALLLLDVPSRQKPTLSQVLATISGVLASLTIGGFAYGAMQFYVWGPNASGMAINTSVAVLALAFGVVAARPRAGVMVTFVSPHPGGQVLRKMLAVALIIPAIGYGAARAQAAGLCRPPGASIIEGVASMVVAAVIAFAIAESLERADAKRREVEQESREWKRFFDRAAFGATFGTLDGRFGLVNEAFARMHGYTVEELEGRPIADVFPSEKRAEFEEMKRKTHDSGHGVWTCEHIRKDGSRFPVRVDVCAVRSESGVLLYRAAYVQDITEERAADAVRSRLASLVQSAEDAITTQSLDGTLLDWNQGAERIFGYRAEEILGRPVDCLVPDDRQAECRALVGRALAGETIVGFETERVRKDGRTLPIALTLSPILDESTKVAGLSSISRDISALRELEREREEWSSIVAHDLRQPAATIKLTAGAIARQETRPNTQRALDRIRGASDRLERMIGDLLDVSRIDAHRLDIKPCAEALLPLVREVIDATPECTHRCCIQAATDSDMAVVDSQRFVQVLSNLLSNAVKYGYPESPIEVTVGKRGGMVEVTVTNAGMGIAPDELSDLFSRFARTRSAERGDTPGLGLGLYISRAIVEAHGGKLWVESKQGELTHFRFTLPGVNFGPGNVRPIHEITPPPTGRAAPPRSQRS
jgi:PAS domain S-box-containing protein